MRKVNEYEGAEANQGGSFERLLAGGYICRITRVEDMPEKEYLKVEFDIAEGKHRQWFAEIYSRAGFWGGHFVRSYKGSAIGFFKGFITAVENSNAGYTWTWAEQSLVGKSIGLVLAYEEYISQKDGSVKERLYVAQSRSIDAIKKGDFTIPGLKRLKQENGSKSGTAPASYAPPSDMQEITEDMPF
jgi:hypothetical protein